MKRASLAEIMGRQGSEAAGRGLTLDDLPEILGEAMPELPKNAVGRFRLLQGLENRFGPNFRTLPGVRNVLKEFDAIMEVEKRIARIRQIKLKKKDMTRG